MHVRFSTCVGMGIVDDRHNETVAAVTGIFVHPDEGKVEGLFVDAGRGEEFLSVADIAHWGTTVVVRDHDAIAPLDDRVRLSALLAEGRPMLGQRIVTEAGGTIGTCADIQFETETFRVEWLFPRRWLRWKTPIPASSVLEVTPDAVRVRDRAVPAEPIVHVQDINPLEAMGPTAVQG